MQSETPQKTKSFSLQVLEAVLKLLPRRAAVQEIVSDFERALWAAAKATIPGIEIHGCYFHWTQAVWRKCQELGLKVFTN